MPLPINLVPDAVQTSADLNTEQRRAIGQFRRCRWWPSYPSASLALFAYAATLASSAPPKGRLIRPLRDRLSALQQAFVGEPR